jgi:hypothetical protein
MMGRAAQHCSMRDKRMSSTNVVWLINEGVNSNKIDKTSRSHCMFITCVATTDFLSRREQTSASCALVVNPFLVYFWICGLVLAASGCLFRADSFWRLSEQSSLSFAIRVSKSA